MTTLPVEKPNTERRGRMAAVLITLVIISLHGYFLVHAGGLWRDEVNIINLAGSHSLSVMTNDSFPVLLPVMIKGWCAVRLNSDLGLRLFGVLTGLCLVGTLWLAAWTGRRTAPLFGLTLLGLNGYMIFWGDSLRAFGLGAVLIVLALAAMCFLLGKPTWQRTGILAVAATLSVQALYQNAVFFAGIALGGWLVCWQRKDKAAAVKIFVAALVPAVSLLPYLESVMRWQRTTTIRPGFSFKAALDNFNTVLAFPLPQYGWLWISLGLLVMGLGVAILFRASSPPAREVSRMTTAELQIFAGVILLSSVAGYLVFLHFAALITSPWYFLPLMAVVAACFDLGINLPALPRALRTLLYGILIGTVLLSVVFAFRDLNCRFTNVDLVAQRLAKEVSAQDYVVVTPWYLGISFDRYYRGAAPWDTMPPVSDHSTHRFDLVPISEADEARAMQPVLDRISNALQTGHRVWVVGWMRVPAPGHATASREAQFLAEHSESFETVDLKIKGQTSDYEDVSLLQANGWRAQKP